MLNREFGVGTKGLGKKVVGEGGRRRVALPIYAQNFHVCCCKHTAGKWPVVVPMGKVICLNRGTVPKPSILTGGVIGTEAPLLRKL